MTGLKDLTREQLEAFATNLAFQRDIDRNVISILQAQKEGVEAENKLLKEALGSVIIGVISQGQVAKVEAVEETKTDEEVVEEGLDETPAEPKPTIVIVDGVTKKGYQA